MKTIFLSLLITLLSLTSCVTPLKISQLAPNSGKTTWKFGKETVDQTKNNIKTSITFIKSVSKDLVFDIEIFNNSNDTILLAPEELYYKIINKDSIETEHKIYAINPEQILLNLDKKLSKENANIADEMILNLVENTTDLIYTLADKNYNPERDTSNLNTHNVNESRLQSLNNKRDFWEFQTLRKTSIPPKNSIGGRIFFKRNTNAIIYQIHLPVNGNDFKFDFRQNLITP